MTRHTPLDIGAAEDFLSIQRIDYASESYTLPDGTPTRLKLSWFPYENRYRVYIGGTPQVTTMFLHIAIEAYNERQQ